MEPKVRAIVSYITPIGWIVAVATNTPRDELASYHIRQALGIFLFAFVCSFSTIVPILGWIVAFFGYIISFVLWIMGLISALEGTMKPVPLLGEKFQEWFAGL